MSIVKTIGSDPYSTLRHIDDLNYRCLDSADGASRKNREKDFLYVSSCSPQIVNLDENAGLQVAIIDIVSSRI
jgi:hypothetical protein